MQSEAMRGMCSGEAHRSRRALGSAEWLTWAPRWAPRWGIAPRWASRWGMPPPPRPSMKPIAVPCLASVSAPPPLLLEAALHEAPAVANGGGGGGGGGGGVGGGVLLSKSVQIAWPRMS